MGTSNGHDPTRELPAHRQKGIDDYLTLASEHPELFPPRSVRPLVLDRGRLTEFAHNLFVEQDEDAAVVGLAARTPWHLFLVDVVEIADGKLTTYDRLVPTSVLYRRHGVAVVATATDASGQECIAMVQVERHATGQLHWELPRGFGERHLLPEEHAKKELAEETGFRGRFLRHLGKAHTNTGQTEEQMIFIHLEVLGRESAQADEDEAICDARLWPIETVWNAIRTGEITDSFTIQGLALLEHFR